MDFADLKNVRIEKDNKCLDTWNSILSDIKQEVGAIAFKSWLSKLSYIGVSPEQVIYLSLPSKFLLEWVRPHYGNKITIAGVATGAIAIGVLVAEKLNCPFIYVRPEPKKHGRKNQVEGKLEPNQKVVVIEDLISTGKSSLNAVNAIKKAQCEVVGMLALFTYGFPQATIAFKEAQVTIKTLCDYQHLLSSALHQNKITETEVQTLQKWRMDPSNWAP